jgi:hypothetical protein
VLADGLEPQECEGQKVPRRIARRFAHAERLIDRAESATNAHKAGRKLRGAARLLAKTTKAIDRLAARGGIGTDCAATLAATLTEGERRAVALAMAS